MDINETLTGKAQIPIAATPDQQEKQADAERQTSHSSGFSIVLIGASLVLVGSIAQRVLEFVTRVTVARYLGPEGFGLLSTGIGILSVIGAIVLCGLPVGLVRFISQYHNTDWPRFVYSAFWFVVLGGGSLGLGIWLFAEWIALERLQNPQMVIVLRFVGLSLPFFTVLAIISATFQALKDARAYVLINNLLLPVIRLVGVLSVVFLGWGLSGVFGIYMGGALGLSTGVAFILLQKHSPRILCLRPEAWQNLTTLLRFSAPLLIGTLFGLTIWQIDIILLQHIWGATEAGLYAAALIIGRLPNIVLQAFAFMMAPVIARQYSEGRLQDMQRLYGQTVDLIFTTGLPIAVAFAVFAPLALKVLFGQQYMGVTGVFRFMAIGYFLHSVVGPNGKALIMMGRSKLYLVNTIFSATVTLCLYGLLIPAYGVMGATIATLSGLMLMNGIFSVQLFQQTGINPLPWFRLRLVGVAIIAALPGIFGQTLFAAILPNWMLLGLTLGVYFGAYTGLALLLRIVKLVEVFAFRDLFMKNRLLPE